MNISAAVSNRSGAKPASENVQWLIAALVAMMVAGYPIVAAITTLLSLENSLLSVPFRALLGGLSALLLMHHVVMGTWRPSVLVVGFLTFYLARLVFDTVYSDLPAAFTSLQFYLVSTYLPVLALSVRSDYVDMRKIIMASGFATALACLLLTYIKLSGQFVSASDYEQTGGRFGLAALNAITVSYTGLYAIIIAFAWLPFARSSTARGGLAAMLALGMITMVAGGSRGPFVGLAACLAMIALVGRRPMLLVAMALVGSILFATGYIDTSVVLHRFTGAGLDTSSLERLYYLSSSFDLAIQNPLFGYAYVDPVSGQSPHNLLVESMLALGFGGGAMMLWMQWRVGRLSHDLLRLEYRLLPLLGVTAIMNAWITDSLWGGGGVLFASLALMIALTSRVQELAGSTPGVTARPRRQPGPPIAARPEGPMAPSHGPRLG
jgi:hypothetical protein